MKDTRRHRFAIHPLLISAGALAILAPAAATAQITQDDGPSLLEVKVDMSYTFGGETEFRGRTFGDTDAFNANFSVGSLVPLSESWFIPFELQSQYLSLGTLAGVPLPDAISTLEFGTGLAYRPEDRWMLTARLNTALYKLEEIGGNDIGISGGLMARWEYSPSLTWIIGAMYQPDNDLPVIPLVGVEWMISEQWQLQLMLLAPRLTYSLDDQWKFHVGMGLNFGTTFRTDDDLGTSIGLPRYNDALASYSDMRIGCGADYQLNKSFSLETELGYSLGREIEYTDLDEKVKFDPAPYLRVGLKYEF